MTLREAAAKHNLFMGAARNYYATTAPDAAKYNSLIAAQFSLTTPENGCKFKPTEPSLNSYSWTQCDVDSNSSFAAGQVFRGHNLCWGNYNPNWLVDPATNWTQAQLETILEDHVQHGISRYGDRFLCWDVVNEAVASNPPPSGSPFKDVDPWYPTVPNYVDLAFKTAGATRGPGSKLKLFYNDFGAEGMNNKSDAIHSMVAGMKSRGIPIDGVGLQMHVSYKYFPSTADLEANIKRLGELGLDVHITEMDVKCPANECTLETQAAVYVAVMQACLNQPACKSFETWGVYDGRTWLGSDQRPLLFDVNYQPKPAVNALLALLQKPNPASVLR